MMFDVEAMQLQDEVAILHQLLIVGAAVSPVAAQQALIPPAAGCDVRDTNERLGKHGLTLTELWLWRVGKRVAAVAESSQPTADRRKPALVLTAGNMGDFWGGDDEISETGD
jgi:hypothetical protein